MSGILKWFRANAKIKRWLLLNLIGVCLICYGIAKILVLKTLTTLDVMKIICSFVLGFLAIVISIVHIQKRTLEILVEDSDTRKKTNNVNTLIFNKKIYNQGPKIVVIGGGSGLNTVLRGLKHYTDNITAIVTVSDYGETPSNSRTALQVLPLKDVQDSLSALAYDEFKMKKLLDCKFDDGKLKSLSFGDIYFLAMNKIYGNFSESIGNSTDVLNITGKVLPATLDEIKICAELENGTVVENREKIPEKAIDYMSKISRIFISPTNCKVAPGVLESIREADAIVIGPGSLYTSVIPSLLVNGIAHEIKKSDAIKVYVSNIMTEQGETDDYTLSDHIKAIMDYVGENVIDYCIYDTGEIVPEYIKKYNLEGQDLVIADVDNVKGIKFLQRNLSKISDGNIRHDPELVAESIIELICDDLKYQDKQNDPQYLMLNNKLREDKRINKIKKQMEKENKKGKKPKEEKKRNSKFSNKYSERIESIKKSDEMVKIKEEKYKKEKKSKKKNNNAKINIPMKKRTPQEIREAMIEELEHSKLGKDIKKDEK